MTDQPTLFDALAAEQERDAALHRVEQHAEPAWHDAALLAVLRAAKALPEFIVDEVWRFLPPSVEEPHEPRAMGAVMRQAHRDGLIAPTDRFVASERVTAHRNPRRVWLSRVYQAGA